MTIRGSARGTLLDCAERQRHFVITGANVTLQALHLIHGSALPRACVGRAADGGPCSLDPDGGCVLVLGKDARLLGCNLTACRAAGRGGGIHAEVWSCSCT